MKKEQDRSTGTTGTDTHRFYDNEQAKRAAELVIANKELAFQNDEKEKRAAELIIANRELALQNNEKEKRAAELIIANKELAFQNDEKEKRAAELIVANTELALQNNEKEQRAAELIIANKELALQNKEKEKRAAELIIANKALALQNEEKVQLTAELIAANKALAFQNNEKEERAAELIIANKELAFQNDEKEKRAAELVISNKELAFQIEEKEKREAELLIVNKELLAFTYISSHDLQEPLRKIQIFTNRILETEMGNLSTQGKDYFQRLQGLAARMQQLIIDLLIYSRVNSIERKFEQAELITMVNDLKKELKEIILRKQAVIQVNAGCTLSVIPFQFRQLLHNLISNALKFSKPGIVPVIKISSDTVNNQHDHQLSPAKTYTRITIEDNGIGFEAEFSERMFEVFQKIHQDKTYLGTGIGLAIVRKIVENHNGIITASGELGRGAKFEIYIPAN